MNNFSTFVEAQLKVFLINQVSKFQAGQLFKHIIEQCKLTSDFDILTMVAGDNINFEVGLPSQNVSPPNTIPQSDYTIVEKEVCSLLAKQVIVPSQREAGEFVSPIFINAKKDGKIRVVLNLKRLNESVQNCHFKMDTIHAALKLVSPNCWISSIDLKDAYYSVRIAPQYQNYLKFFFNDQLYQFTAFSNGLSSCAKKLTKLIKPVLAKLRLQGYDDIIYIDDLLILGTTYAKCVEAVLETSKLLLSLGFVIHLEKSGFFPKQCIIFRFCDRF